MIVLNRSWESALTDTMIGATPTHSKPGHTVSIMLDPPYRLDKTKRSFLYGADHSKNDVNDVAIDSFKWAVANGDKYKVAYCCHDGDFDLPAGWTLSTKTFSGQNLRLDSRAKDCVMFSPACVNNGVLV